MIPMGEPIIKEGHLASRWQEEMEKAKEFKRYGIKVYAGAEYMLNGDDYISVAIEKVFEQTIAKTMEVVISTLETLHISPKLVEAQVDTIKTLNNKVKELQEENRQLRNHLELCEKRMGIYIKMLQCEVNHDS